MAKERYGFPTGCGAHNSINQWNDRANLDKETYRTGIVVANVFQIAMGADFLLYGPMNGADEAYAACSLADSYVAYSSKQEFDSGPMMEEHPLFRIFRR